MNYPRTTTPASPVRILIAEDSTAYQNLLRVQLETAGYGVDIVPDGGQLLRFCDPGRHRLILLDLGMPGIGGLQALKILRSESLSDDVPVLILTGDDDQARQRLCLQAGAAAVLTKPVRRDRLLQTIAACLRDGEATPAPAATELPPILNESHLRDLEQDTSPALLPKLANMLLAESHSHVQEIRRLARQANARECARKAHALKSIAATLGAERLSHLAAELQGHCEQDPKQPLTECAAALERTMRDTHRIFNDRLVWNTGGGAGPA